MEFADFKNNSIEKLNCSPEQIEESDLVFNMPKQVAWGQPIPICGHIKTKEDSNKDFATRAYVSSETPIWHNTSFTYSWEIPSEIRYTKISEVIKSSGELYFNFQIMTDRILPPGEYKIYLDAYSGPYSSEKKKFSIQAVGWLKEFADQILKWICQDEIEDKIKSYTKLLGLAKIETSASPEAARSMQKDLAETWSHGFSTFRQELSSNSKERLREQTWEIDRSISAYVTHQKKIQCPSVSADWVFVDDLLSAIRLYELK